MPNGVYTSPVDLAAVRAAIRAERTKRKWSLDDLAEKSGVHRMTIHEVETNAHGKPQLATVARLVEGMGLTLSAFFARIEGLQTTSAVTDNLPSPISIRPEVTQHGGRPVPHDSGGGVPSNEFVHEAIVIAVANTLGEAFIQAVDRLAARLAEPRGQDPTTRPRKTTRHARDRKTG